MALGGSYVGFTSKPLTNDKIDDFVAAIREGIKDAGGEPTLLPAIKIYDANKIADWASRHVAVATWLAEYANGQSVAGFRTVSDWARSDDFSATVHVEDAEPRFRKGARTERDEAGAENKSSAATAWRWVLDHIAELRTIVRISGSSGLGKSRFVYEGLKSSEGSLAEILRATTVFADYRVVPSTLLAIATRLASEGKAALLVVDECPRAVAADLAVIATAADSRLRVITIDTDHRPLDGERVLHVALEPSSGNLVRAIIKQKNSALASPAVERLLEISGGFPVSLSLRRELPMCTPLPTKPLTTSSLASSMGQAYASPIKYAPSKPWRCSRRSPGGGTTTSLCNWIWSRGCSVGWIRIPCTNIYSPPSSIIWSVGMATIWPFSRRSSLCTWQRVACRSCGRQRCSAS
ncbi:hypothetical protein [uncultured Devosia sp.]|uniref:hypothetical protein n=1 Tax=uncultured Devosia sp. TaxID=211434 RepID=UPI0035CAFF23